VSERFIRMALIWFCAGVLLGAYMGISHQHLDKQVHVHGLLLGWVSCALFALVHRAWPAMQALRAAVAHLWLHNVGLLVLLTGLALEARQPSLAGLFLGIGTVAIVVAVGMFAWCVWRATAHVNARSRHQIKLAAGQLHTDL
jgi:predicted lysophospholipase L1 biosynthesis ABC-type transport system permease subunit